MKITKQFLNELSINEIEELIKLLNEVLMQKKEHQRILDDLFSQAQQSGIDAKMIVNHFNKTIKSSSSKRRKYCLEINGIKQYYSGSGKKPKWLLEYINNGGNLKDIEVNE